MTPKRGQGDDLASVSLWVSTADFELSFPFAAASRESFVKALIRRQTAIFAV
ncbi:hypothetical protein J41TS2_44490 [Bacillus sonorensis]|nr:hypothetical protein J41TS2_44490 [Bacillus sonorensis]